MGGEYFGSRSISRAAKTENPVPRSFFAPKPNRKTLAAQAHITTLLHSSVPRCTPAWRLLNALSPKFTHTNSPD